MLVFAAPILVVAVVWWLISRTERIVHHLLPYLEWEHSLGWLNTKAERRANMGMRALRFMVYVMLFDSLFGIVWGAKGLQHLDNWSDPWVMGELAVRVPALCFCLGIWVVYLGTYVFPRIRAEREAADWKKIQADMKADEEEKKACAPHLYSRVKTPLQKPRKSTLQDTLKKPAPTYQEPAPTFQRRARRSFGPGG
jgi:hypothetical protein